MNNITGMAVFNATLAGKRIELTKELLPTAAVMGKKSLNVGSSRFWIG